jgi:hypothetical protein
MYRAAVESINSFNTRITKPIDAASQGRTFRIIPDPWVLLGLATQDRAEEFPSNSTLLVN